MNERQKKAIEFLQIKGKITRKDHMKITSTTKTTAVRDMNELVNKGILLITGPKTGRGRYYVLNLKVS